MFCKCISLTEAGLLSFFKRVCKCSLCVSDYFRKYISKCESLTYRNGVLGLFREGLFRTMLHTEQLKY